MQPLPRVPMTFLPSAVFVLSACLSGGDGLEDVRADPGDLPNVWRVQWHAGTAGASWVEYGLDGSLDHHTPETAPTAEPEVVLLGLAAGRTYTWQAVTRTPDGRELRGPLQELETTPPPPDLGPLDLTWDDPDLRGEEAFVLTSAMGLGGTWVVALDRRGEVAWLAEEEPGRMILSVEPGRDGQSLLYAVADRDQRVDVSQVVRVSLDGSEEQRTRTPMGHHDFAELPDGTIAALGLAVEPAVVDGEEVRVVGDLLLELPPGADDRTKPRVVFDFFRDYAPPWPASPDFEDDPYNLGARDWTHCNSLAYDDAEDAYYLMCRNLDALLCIDRSTGDLRWQLGGRDSDWTFDGEPWSHGHFSDLDGDRLLVFDNGVYGESGVSRVVEYHLDRERRVATQTWELEHPAGGFIPILGDARRLDGGNTLVSWTTDGVIAETTPGGRGAWQVTSALGTGLGRAWPVRSLYDLER